MRMHCSINMLTSKQLYQFKQENLTCLEYENYGFNHEECDLKVIIVVGMWLNRKWK